MGTRNKRSGRSMLYTALMGYKCAYPDCHSGLNAEGHHIIPISKGGVDAFWNMISLCFKCHRGNKLHTRWLNLDVELYTWKCQAELERFGFYIDEKEDNFREHLKQAILISKNLI